MDELSDDLTEGVDEEMRLSKSDVMITTTE